MRGNRSSPRGFEYHWDEDGSLVFSGRLPTEVGAMLLEALKMGMDRADEEADVSAKTRESMSARRADVLAGMAESYLATGSGESYSAERYQVMVHVTAETRLSVLPCNIAAASFTAALALPHRMADPALKARPGSDHGGRSPPQG